ncbi:MAG: hypothetical protein JKY67_19050 [Pseudomonadales bacterium]|nr:hypothetical protein [Pseudomonadales bacterium]
MTIQSNADSLSDADRRGIGREVESILDQMLALLNTKDGSGEYIFGGYQGADASFVKQPGGGYEYLGDAGTRSVEIAAGYLLQVSDPGKNIFVDVKSASSTIYTSASPNNTAVPPANISTGIILDQEAFDDVYPEDFNIVFNDPLVNQNQRTFTITQRSDGAPVFGTRPGGYMVNVPYNDGELLEFHGVEFFITGDPEAGDTFFIESSATESTLDTIDRLAAVLKLQDTNRTQLATLVEVIGRATPGRTTTTLAGNYVSAQRVTLETETTIEEVDIVANESAPSIAFKIDAMIGVTATALPTIASLDFSGTTMDEGDLVQFELNGVPISAVVGSSDTATRGNIQAAIVAAAVPNLTSTNTNGVLELTEALGNNIELQNFQVVDVPGISLDIISGVNTLDTVTFTITGTGGESVDINYTDAGNGNDDLLAGIIADLAADPEGDGSLFRVSQASLGGPVELRYIGDTDGLSNFQITGFDDTGSDAQLSIGAVLGSSVIDTSTAVAATSLTNGTDITVLAVDANATMSFRGGIGDPVTLLEGSTDSSNVAGRLSITVQPGFDISSNVSSGFGGLFLEVVDLEEVTNDRFQSTIARVLANIDNSLESILKTRSSIGARLNTLDSTLELNAGITIELRTYLSDLQDLDYAEAITTMSMQTLILEAAQNSFVKISSLTLFNFL